MLNLKEKIKSIKTKKAEIKKAEKIKDKKSSTKKKTSFIPTLPKIPKIPKIDISLKPKKISIPISEYFQIIKPEYVAIKVIPDTSIRNYDSAKIAKAIYGTYQKIGQKIRLIQKEDAKRFKKFNKKLVIQTPHKFSFFIDIRPKQTSFYFISSEKYADLIKNKINEVWSKATITIVPITELKPFSENALEYGLSYKFEDAMSLTLDKKCNEPLNSILSVIEMLHEETEDRIGIFYNFIPRKQTAWKKNYKETLEKIKNKEPIDKQKLNPSYVSKMSIKYVLELLDFTRQMIADFCGSKKSEKDANQLFLESAITSLAFKDEKDLTKATISKKNSTILDTQIVVFSDSKDELTKKNNSATIINSYASLDEDNELIARKVNTNKKENKFNFTDKIVNGVEENKMSIHECQNLIELPGRDLLSRFKSIDSINIQETKVPEQLKKGIICIGTSEYKGTKEKVFLCTDKDYRNLTLILVGATRSGKSTLIANIVNDAINAGQCSIILDFIETCGLSEEIANAIPADKQLHIRCDDMEHLQAIGYNEVEFNPDNNWETYRGAKQKAIQITALLNSVNTDDKALSVKMEKFLEAACLIVSVQDGSVLDTINVLENPDIRHKFIDNIPAEQILLLKDYIKTLEQLDIVSTKKDNEGEIIGNNDNLIVGILDRFYKLKKNPYIELTLNMSSKNNINLVKELEKPQVIFVEMPENMFSTDAERDMYTTYWLTKIWLALQIRAWRIKDKYQRKTVNVVIDELYQVERSEEFVRQKISQCAKFGMKFIISCMSIDQISILKGELKSANASYMFISGCDKSNYKEFKEELDPFELEDLLGLPRFYALSLIKYEDGYAKLKIKMPKPLKNKKSKNKIEVNKNEEDKILDTLKE